MIKVISGFFSLKILKVSPKSVLEATHTHTQNTYFLFVSNFNYAHSRSLVNILTPFAFGWLVTGGRSISVPHLVVIVVVRLKYGVLEAHVAKIWTTGRFQNLFSMEKPSLRTKRLPDQ